MFFTDITHIKNSVIISFKYKLFKEMFKMPSAAAQKASTKSFQIFSTFAVVDPIQANPSKTEKSRPNPTQPNPWVNPTHDNSGVACTASTRCLDTHPRTCRQQGRLLCHKVLVGVSGRLLEGLQSVLTAAARLIFSPRRSDHISPLLYHLNWLRIPERIKFRLCSLKFRRLHGTAASYLVDSLRRTASAEGRRHLLSSVTTSLVVPSTRRSTLGDRAFQVASARTWNELPASVRNAPSLLTFCRELKALLFAAAST